MLLSRPCLIEVVDDDDGELTVCVTPLRVVPLPAPRDDRRRYFADGSSIPHTTKVY